MNKNKYENENKRLYTNRPYNIIEKNINNFDYNEKNNNKNTRMNTSIKQIMEMITIKMKKKELLIILKNVSKNFKKIIIIIEIILL